jgi:SSS family solute:Na+ symporter
MTQVLTPTFAPIDYALITAYFVLVVAFGWKTSRRNALSDGSFPRSEAAEDFLVAGRKLSLPAFVATLVATWYGGILGVGEFSYTQGLASWLALGVFYYICAIIYAFTLAAKIQSGGIQNAHLTIADRLKMQYGKGVGVLSAVFIFVMITPAPYILITAILLQLIFGISLSVAIVVGTMLSVVYVFSGGLESVVKADVFQFLLMFFGFGVVVPFAVAKYGGFDFLKTHLPATHLMPTGTLSMQQVFVWGLIALWTFVDPNFFQRCLAARTPRTARNGILVSVLCWMVFDFLTCTAGLYARAALPDIVPTMSYPLLAEAVLPAVWKGLFYTGMLATVMSTVSGYTFLSAMTIGRDFLSPLMSPARNAGEASATEVKRFVNWGMLITCIIGSVVAYLTQSVIGIWYTLGTIAIPALLFPLLSTFSPKWVMQKNLVMISILASASASIGWLVTGIVLGSLASPVYPFELEPMYAGLGLSAVIFIFSQLKKI